MWQQGGTYPANYDRALINTLWPAGGGQGAAAAAVGNTMNISIPPGTIAVPLQSGQNTALCRWDAAEVVSSTAAPASGSSRIDMVICQVRDPLLDGGGNNDFVFLVLAGTVATPGPGAAPTVPANAAPVCQYTVAGGSANLNGVTIVDARRGLGTTPVFASTAERDSLWPSPPPGAECVTLEASGNLRRWTRLGGIWYQPNSLLGYGVDAASRTGISATPYTYPITVPVTVPAGRVLRVTLSLILVTAAAGTAFVANLLDGAATVGRLMQDNSFGSNSGQFLTGSCLVVGPAAGAHTYGFNIAAGANTLDVRADITPTRLDVTDIGPTTP